MYGAERDNVMRNRCRWYLLLVFLAGCVNVYAPPEKVEKNENMKTLVEAVNNLNERVKRLETRK